eukprot:CAMPEP_0202455364 /NCGR_PEP_ID=MMETSP1360-20130828/12915_1 /ASSEMBLY_ACC=CAM_ASM_000848 /TAXON_ID=515479 /ORGANISM="Licmophora paradoxa, Strain CCMP2313" /LENGTH=952 /DNA_ID=CAMNT_0049074933 /DNA_START=46 /DNA_END=2904 /DNA_ORIENTATION=+
MTEFPLSSELLDHDFGVMSKRINSFQEDDDDVMALAASLAPAMEELDYLLSGDPTAVHTKLYNLTNGFNVNNSSSNSMNMNMNYSNLNNSNLNNNNSFHRRTGTVRDDISITSDNSMDGELNRLAESERILRKELEQELNIGALFLKFKTHDDHHHQDGEDHTQGTEPPESESSSAIGDHSFIINNKKNLLLTDDHHDHHDDPHHEDGTQGHYHDDPHHNHNHTPREQEEYEPYLHTFEDIDDTDDDTIGVDADLDDIFKLEHYNNNNDDEDQSQDYYDEDEDDDDDDDDEMPPDKTLNSVSLTNHSNPKDKQVSRHSYTLADHSRHLRMEAEARGGWYHIRVTPVDIREYIVPIPDKELQRIYADLNPCEDDDSSITFEATTSTNNDTTDFSPQNDKVFHHQNSGSNQTHHTNNTKSSHATLPPLPLRTVLIKLRPDALMGSIIDTLVTSLPWLDVKQRNDGHVIMKDVFGIRLDCQIVTYKGSGTRFSDRVLLIRVYYKQESDQLSPPELGEDFSQKANLKLKEAAALVQRLETSKRGATEGIFSTNFFNKHPVFPNQRAMQKAIAEKLLKKYKPCPSALEGELTLPALSDADWPWVKYSWRYITAVWEALQDRFLTYSTLPISPFGQTPNLSTIDAHYLAQLRAMCRENMVISLLKSASELEQYARDAEYACASLIQILKPCYENYRIEPPPLPSPVPLTSYPLNFVPHENRCPPWGQKVMEALKSISEFDSTVATSAENTKNAVEMVISAFERQNDEEQSARLGRKNEQVMDRLARMQAHKRVSVETLQKSFDISPRAKKAALDFHSFAKKYGSNVEASREVPLFKCNILVGSEMGACFVTASQIMCVSSGVLPFIRGNRITLLDLDGLVFKINDNPPPLLTIPSMLSPLPPSISICLADRVGGQEVCAFRPTYGAARLKNFLEILQAAGRSEMNEYTDSGCRQQIAS